jgi:hypothetical protein
MDIVNLSEYRNTADKNSCGLIIVQPGAGDGLGKAVPLLKGSV